MKGFLVPLAMIMLSLASCGSKSKVKQDEAEQQKACFYTYDHASSMVQWTAFKFTEKTAVAGSFNELIVQSSEGSENPASVLESLNFKIPASSVETQNEERNVKIVGIFFKTFATDTIRGKVKKIDLKKGIATIQLQMNGVRKEVEGTCSLEERTFTFKAGIDVSDWNGSDAIKALNKVCKDLHTGADGKSVLWSTIDLSFTTTLKSDCE